MEKHIARAKSRAEALRSGGAGGEGPSSQGGLRRRPSIVSLSGSGGGNARAGGLPTIRDAEGTGTPRRTARGARPTTSRMPLSARDESRAAMQDEDASDSDGA